MFWYVSSYEFIGVFYTSFLPGGVCIRKIDNYIIRIASVHPALMGVCIRKIDNHIVFAFHVQAFGN